MHACAPCTHAYSSSRAPRSVMSSAPPCLPTCSPPPSPYQPSTAPHHPYHTLHSIPLSLPHWLTRPPTLPQVCILAKTYTAAMPMLQQPLLQANPCRPSPDPCQTLARPLPDPCQTLARPLPDPAAALGPWRGMLIEAREDARSRGEAPLHWRQVRKAATLVICTCMYTHVHRWTRRRRW